MTSEYLPLIVALPLLGALWNGVFGRSLPKASVTFAYEASGGHGLRNPSLLQRCFRDMYVGAAHLVFDERNYAEAVKARLGLEPLPF